MNRLFVYGTLKKGQYYHDRYLGNGKSVPNGPATTSKDYQMYVDALPHLVKEQSKTGCQGEVYLVSDEVLESIDKLEGHPVVYQRELINIFDETGKEHLAWAYLRQKEFKGKAFAYKEENFE